MEIKFDENDLKVVKRINEETEDHKFLYVSSTNKNYDLRFQVTDIGKANTFIQNLLHDRDESIEKSIGIKVLELRYPELCNDRDKLINYLERVIERLKEI